MILVFSLKIISTQNIYLILIKLFKITGAPLDKVKTAKTQLSRLYNWSMYRRGLQKAVVL